MRISNCKKYDTDEKYDGQMIKDFGHGTKDTCKVLCTSFVSSNEKLCSNEYCRYITPVNK